MDEKPAVGAMRARFLQMAAAGATLASLSADQLTELRTGYFESAGRFADRPAGAILLDKLPLNIVWTHLIWRVFPEARFVLALRHPLDVCLSAFMQSFAMNRAMTGFLTLRGAALTYAAVMDLWNDQTRRLPLIHQAVRYEDVVADPPGQLAGILRFVGLDWDDQVLVHPARGGRAAIINTPSYHQVARPVHKEAVERWRRYETHLGAERALLSPFIDRFGYGEAAA